MALSSARDTFDALGTSPEDQTPPLARWLAPALRGLLRFDPAYFGLHVAPALAWAGAPGGGLLEYLKLAPIDDLAEVAERFFATAGTGISLTERWSGVYLRRLLDCNPAFAALAGRERRELIDLGDLRGLQVRLHKAEMSASMQALVEFELPFYGAASWRRPDGRPNVFEFKAIPLRLGQRLFVAGFDRDITH